MRPADNEETIEWRGLTVTIREWCDPTDMPWDGDEPLPENAEGWDVLVRVSVRAYGQVFTAQDSLGSNWFVPDSEGQAWFREQVTEVRDCALAALASEIATEASEAPILKAQARRKAAAGLLSRLQPITPKDAET